MSPSTANEKTIKNLSLDKHVWNLTVEDLLQRHTETLIFLHQASAQIKATELRLIEKEKKIQELESLASTDPMTGLMNRRGFESFFAQELERSRRHNTSGSVLILFDLDKFKEINDTYGHQAGDACLKRVGEYLLKNIRSIDAAARIGGDEFAILLSNTDREKSENCINKIIKGLDNLSAAWQGKMLAIRASIGIKDVSETSSYENAYHAADQELYINKQQRKSLYAIPTDMPAMDDSIHYKIKNLGHTVYAPKRTRENEIPLCLESRDVTLPRLLLDTL